MADIAIAGWSARASANGNPAPLTIEAPSSTAAGDLIVIAASMIGIAVAGLAPPSGFTQKAATSVGSGGDAGVTYLWWKRLAAPEPSGTTYIATPSGSSTSFGIALRITDAVTIGDPFTALNENAETANASSTPAVSLAGVERGSLLLWAVGSATNRGLSSIPSGFTEIDRPAIFQGLELAARLQATTSSSGTLVGTYSGTSPRRRATLVSIKGGSPQGQITSTATPATASSTVVEGDAITATATPATAAIVIGLNLPAVIAATATPATADVLLGIDPFPTIASTATPATANIDLTLSRVRTWRETIRTAEFIDAARSATRVVSSRVEMIDRDGKTVADLPIVTGSVSCDSTVDERWAASITVDDPDLMPSTVADLLHPLSGLRARIWWMLTLPSGFIAEVPCGTYYSSEPAAKVTSTGTGAFGMGVKLLDPMSRIRRNKWGPGDVINLGGINVGEALRRVFADRAPNLNVQIAPTTAKLPTVYEVGEVGRDPLADILAIADAAAFTVYSDREGNAVCEPRVTTSNTPTVLDLSVGVDCRMESVDRSLDESQLLNVLTVRSTSPDVDPPVYATVKNNDRSSPLWVGLGVIYSDVIDSDAVTAENGCRALATATLSERNSLLESVDVVHRSRPDIDPQAVVAVNEPQTGTQGTYQTASWAIDLSPGSMQRTVLTDRRIEV